MLAVLCVAFSPDGKTLASGSSDKTVKLWDVRTRELKRTLEEHSEMVTAIVFSSDGKNTDERKLGQDHNAMGRTDWTAEGGAKRARWSSAYVSPFGERGDTSERSF